MRYFKLIFLVNAVLTISCSFAQKQTLDVVSFVIPGGWQQQQYENSIQLSATEKKTGAYAFAVITKANPSSASAKENFDDSWNKLVKGALQINVEPALEQPTTENGWDIISGRSNYTDGADTGTVTLLTASGGGQTVSVVLITNTKKYQDDLLAFLHSLELAKPQQSGAGNPMPVTKEETGKSAIAGTWISRSSSNEPGVSGYIENEYIFNNDGSYSFYSKTFNQSISKLILKKEKGTFIISGEQITLVPGSSITEGWSKKNGIDEFGRLLSSQENSLERTTYQFTKYYFEGIREWSLVLQAGAPTKRDGPFSSNKLFNNAWYYSMASAYKPAIKLPLK